MHLLIYLVDVVLFNTADIRCDTVKESSVHYPPLYLSNLLHTFPWPHDIFHCGQWKVTFLDYTTYSMWIYPICPLVAICWTWMKQSTSWSVVPYTVSFQACFLEANIGRLRPPPPSWRARVILKWRSGVETLAFWNHKHTFYQRFALQTNKQY